MGGCWNLLGFNGIRADSGGLIFVVEDDAALPQSGYAVRGAESDRG